MSIWDGLPASAALQQGHIGERLGHTGVAHKQLRPRLQDDLPLGDDGGVDEHEMVVLGHLEVQGHVLTRLQEEHLPYPLLLNPLAQSLPGLKHELFHVRKPVAPVPVAGAREACPALEGGRTIEKLALAVYEKSSVAPHTQRCLVAESHGSDQEIRHAARLHEGLKDARVRDPQVGHEMPSSPRSEELDIGRVATRLGELRRHGHPYRAHGRLSSSRLTTELLLDSGH
mmetsp:Transcript_14436/g.31637  ORF Transcript_14436/g.31637 Transcript_14436/m.31637 type:complete len:228 (+) Transcript_14436:637-1320(+)